MKNKVFRRFLRRKVSVVAAIILLTIILACIFGPMFITTDPLEQDILNAYQAPSSAHWFGTDNMGRDIFIRMPYCPLNIHVQRNPIAIPGTIQLTSVTPRRNSAPLNP